MMLRRSAWWMSAGMCAALVTGVLGSQDEPAIVVVDRDNVRIEQSCTVQFGAAVIEDADGNGVIHIVGDGITVNLDGGRLRGAAEGASPDGMSGVGVRITGKNVTLKNGVISGFKTGVHATGADGLMLYALRFDDNFRQRLKSTPQAEDASDWLWPHRNDANEWLENYGAAVYVEDAKNVQVGAMEVRRGQNGIVLDRVNDSKLYDNDCSFLSGWGIALWRSSGNTISRNAMDFCIRGYSHGVYNRGQDSAGLLLFEQCSDNVILNNSATHCGDGLFIFAGREALGEVPPAAPVDAQGNAVDFQNEEARLAWYRGRGCNRNIIRGNDFSYAAAHGIELTFSFENDVAGNRIVENGITGLWGGYSQETLIKANTFERNGQAGSTHERGGVNIEHGRRNVFQRNRFAENECGIFLWWDEDEAIAKTPWAQANGVLSTDNVIYVNQHRGDRIGVQLVATSNTQMIGGTYNDVEHELDADPASEASIVLLAGMPRDVRGEREVEEIGETWPVGAREPLQGRDRIIMTEWGPYDWKSPMLRLAERSTWRHAYEVVGEGATLAGAKVTSSEGVSAHVEGERLIVMATEAGARQYDVKVTMGETTLTARGVVTRFTWKTMFFATGSQPNILVDADGKPQPRPDDEERYQRYLTHAKESFIAVTLEEIDLRFGNDGPTQLPIERLQKSLLPKDHFGVIAESTVRFGPGKWKIRTVSDDGIRVFMDGEQVIDDWTHHAPREQSHVFEVAEPREVKLRVEYFELTGFAVLKVDLERAD